LQKSHTQKFKISTRKQFVTKFNFAPIKSHYLRPLKKT